ncbi:MAG: type II toxin-antitoxin system HicA family toxin [Anaerolineae bacterium]|nr:type II toxin-antitoxin system HicA family toxin [Anaerolineae bacterium]MBK9234113.1 type II toxin-antitoxin system HicA family toxin [Anaerolineae bacterium]
MPHHPGDIPKGTLNAILKQLGIDRDEFDNA